MAGAALSPDAPAPAAAPRQPPDPAKVVARVNGAAESQEAESFSAVAATDPALQLPDVPDEQKRELLMVDPARLGARAAEAAKVADAPRSPASSRIEIATRHCSTNLGAPKKR